MTNLQKQMRLSALLETIRTDKKNGMYEITGNTREQLYKTSKESIRDLDPFQEQDLMTRAMATKNLLTAFEIDCTYGDFIDSEYWGEVRQRIVDALEDQSYSLSDDEIAKEMQNANKAYALRQVRHHNYLYDGIENGQEKYSNLFNDVLNSVDETFENDLLNQKENAADLVRGL